ncbi:MAG: MarR family transcriptional regulator [Bacteroidia bacterium]|nr:MarR family transcriptional regulator [Bacteroidia bacterium]
MNSELQLLIDQFLKILHLYSVISRKPVDYGTGDLLYFTEIHTITTVGKNREINMTHLAEKMGVTRGAISQTIRKLESKNLVFKSNSNNKKEFNLKLSEKGQIAYKGQMSFQREIFTFAETLYEKGTVQNRELVKGLFEAIIHNMQERVKAMEANKKVKS